MQKFIAIGSLIGCLGLMATPAPAMQQVASAETAEESDESTQSDVSTRIVCRRVPAATGTRVGSRRICKTQAQWDRIRQENREVLERVQRTPLTGN